MVVRLPLMRPFDVITFDCYGTLIDWEAGITEAFRDAAAADGVRLDPAAVLPALFDTRPAAEAPVYRSYREILTDAQRYSEDVLLRLRLADGLPLPGLEPAGREAAQRALADGLLDPAAYQDRRAVLTLRGRLLADAVVRDLLP